jgi:hypothetical protein
VKYEEQIWQLLEGEVRREMAAADRAVTTDDGRR